MRIIIFACCIMFLTWVCFAQVTDLTANWKTYRSEELGFQIAYSPDWETKTVPNSAYFIISRKPNPSVMAIIGREDNLGLSLDQLTTSKLQHLGQYEDNFKISRSSLGGWEAIRVEGSLKKFPEAHQLDFYIIKDKYLYIISFGVNPGDDWNNYSSTFDAIIATFKFIE